MLGRKTELVIGTVFLIFGLLAVCIWVPMDSETGIVETFRRQTNLGDGFIPMLSATLISICALAHLNKTLRRKDDVGANMVVVNGTSIAFLMQISGILFLSLLVMYWAGPLAVKLFAQGDGTTDIGYRQMRSTYPYKLIGFVLGGFAMVYLTTIMIEGRRSPWRILSSALVVVCLIALFDLPFDTVLLPPNGDW